MKIAVMIDSAADINKEDAKKENVFVTRFTINIDGKDYLDEEDINLEQFKKYLNEDCDMKTSQTSIGMLIQQWDKLFLDFDHIIYLTLSEKLSGAYSSAFAAAQDYKGKVTVVDTKAVAYPLQIIRKQALKLLELGKSPKEIKEIIESNEPMFAYLIPNDIKHLKKGGRISPSAAALANLLKIVPVLVVEEGKIDAYAKVRTNKKAVNKAFNDIIKKFENPEDYHWFILHSDLEEQANEYKERLIEEIDQPVTIAPLHPTLLVHAGPKTFVIATLKKI